MLMRVLDQISLTLMLGLGSRKPVWLYPAAGASHVLPRFERFSSASGTQETRFRLLRRTFSCKALKHRTRTEAMVSPPPHFPQGSLWQGRERCVLWLAWLAAWRWSSLVTAWRSPIAVLKKGLTTASQGKGICLQPPEARPSGWGSFSRVTLRRDSPGLLTKGSPTTDGIGMDCPFWMGSRGPSCLTEEGWQVGKHGSQSLGQSTISPLTAQAPPATMRKGKAACAEKKLSSLRPSPVTSGLSTVKGNLGDWVVGAQGLPQGWMSHLQPGLSVQGIIWAQNFPL